MSDKKQKKSLKGYYLITFLIGLGFFTMGLMDPLYDTFVPIFLGKYINSNGIIGAIMTLDNILAIFLIPIFAALSDRTRTRIGRRMPYIVTLLPITALLFGFIPFASNMNLVLLILVLCLLNLFKQSVRGPIVALMPDIIPGDLRSEANGVINTMGGIATIVGTVVLARFMDMELNIGPIHIGRDILAFPISTILVITAVILLFIFVKENRSNYAENKSEKKAPIIKSIKYIFSEKEKSALFILLSLLCWFLAYQGALPFLGKYSKEIIGTSSGTASLAAGMVGIAYAIFAIPSGKYAHRHGRKKTIRRALLVLVIVLTCLFVHSLIVTPKNFSTHGLDRNFEVVRTVDGKSESIRTSALRFEDNIEAGREYSYCVQLLDDSGKVLYTSDSISFATNSQMKDYEIAETEGRSDENGNRLVMDSSIRGKDIALTWSFSKSMPFNLYLVIFWVLLFCFGIFWVTVVTNSFPMLWQMADYRTIGIFTGLYYFFSQLASILAPPITGFLSDMFGYSAIFIYAAFMMLVAFFLMRNVHRGEPEDDPETLE